MIQFYPKYKQFKALVDAKDYENAVRSERHMMIAVFASSTISVRLSTSDWRMLILISLILISRLNIILTSTRDWLMMSITLCSDLRSWYTNHVIKELRMHLSYAKSKSYGYIVDDIKGMYTCCEVSKKLILDFVKEIEYNYGNRPALMRLLRS